MSNDLAVTSADIQSLVTKRFASGVELAFCADDTFPYQLTKQEFDDMPVSLEQRVERETIYRIAAMAKVGPYVDDRITNIEGKCRLIHRFSPGIYCREFHMPANSVIVSRRHAREHICIVSQGSLTVKTEHGEEHITAPASFISHAGVKRIGFIHEDTVWTTIHRTDACSIEEAEAELLLDETEENTAAVLAVLESHNLLGA